MNQRREVSIGQMARRTGLAVSAIRYYEEQGLVTSQRNAGGHRRFRKVDIRRLSFVIIAQKFGFTLPRIRDLLATIPDGRTPNEADWARLANGFREDINARINTLEQMRDNLDGCIGCGCLSMKKCALYNPQDGAQALGSGPRYLMGDTSRDILKTEAETH